MSAKPTSYYKAKQTLPDYEILDPKDPENTVMRVACCICDNPNNTWCYAENPSGAGAYTTSAAAQTLAYWTQA